jgi:ketosteroid isomerase-like protein
MATALPAYAQQACPQEGDRSPAKLHETWILEGWDKRPDDATFVFAEKLGQYYELNAPGVFYDDFAPGQVTMRTPAEYGAMWEGPFNLMRSATHGISDPVEAIMSDSVASSTLEFVARLENADGTVIAIIARSQLGWECISEGRWVIRHEHNSIRETTLEAIAEFLPQDSSN